MSTPTDIQLRVAMQESARPLHGDLKARHFTSSGLLINEYRWGELIAVDRDGNVIHDKAVKGLGF